MPMLADIDDPPRSRARGLLLGFLVSLPIAAVLVGVFMPSLVNAILGGARSFDDRLRQEDAYMQAVCTQAMSLPRDEALCECVLAVEYPALDCQAPFASWSLERQQEYCAAPDNEKASLSFCSCVGAVAEAVAAAEAAGEGEEGRQREAQAYTRCQELPDAVYLPAVEALAPDEG